MTRVRNIDSTFYMAILIGLLDSESGLAREIKCGYTPKSQVVLPVLGTWGDDAGTTSSLSLHSSVTTSQSQELQEH